MNFVSGRRILSRFFSAYVLLYALSESGSVYLLKAIPYGASILRPVFYSIHLVVAFVAIHVFHLSREVALNLESSSGDTAMDYIENLCLVVAAMFLAIAWSILDQGDGKRMGAWLRALIRYTLAFTLLDYGMDKLFVLQFQPIDFADLIARFGDFSPMGVLWRFMGASTPYTIFTGGAEVLGGGLLLFRRTTALGALISFAALANVVALNFCYDVPVKLYSLNLLLMAVFLLTADAGRLINLLILNRTAAPASLGGPWFRGNWRYAAVLLKVLLIGCFVTIEVSEDWTAYRKTYAEHSGRSPLYGLYDVQKAVVNGAQGQPAATDLSQWKRVVFEDSSSILIQMMDGSQHSYDVAYDLPKRTITLFFQENRNSPRVFSYSHPDRDRVIMDGPPEAAPISISLRRIDLSKFTLINRGFHWITEAPFNR